MDPISPDNDLRRKTSEHRLSELETAAMPNLQDPTARLISAIALDSTHPFSTFTKDKTLDIRNALNRYGVGAIVSGAQTGTDSAGFAAAKELGIPTIGFAPRGYINEKGPLSPALQAAMLQPRESFSLCDDETVREQQQLSVDLRHKLYAERTELNAKYSSATLIINPGTLEGGTLLTLECVLRYHQPNKVFIIDPTRELAPHIEEAREWISREKPLFLNIAGPRQSYSTQAGIDIFEASLKTLRAVLA